MDQQAAGNGKEDQSRRDGKDSENSVKKEDNNYNAQNNEE